LTCGATGVTDVPPQAIEKAGFTVVSKRHVQLTTGRAAEFYAEHMGKPFFEKLCGFMSSGPLVALVLAKREAISAWRALMGPTNSLTAKQEAPDSLRAR
jgi:nucleoside diphosphate kinase